MRGWKGQTKITITIYNILIPQNSNEHCEVSSNKVTCLLLLHYKAILHTSLFSTFDSLHLNLNEEVTDWQKWLQKQVFKHQEMCCSTDCHQTDLNPKISINVEMHSRKGIPHFELLQGSGNIIDFLIVTKSNIPLLPPSNKGKQKHSTCMVAITVYIPREIGDSSDCEQGFKSENNTKHSGLF